MMSALEAKLSWMHERFGDSVLTVLTLLLMLLMFVLAPLQAAGLILVQAMGFFVVLALIAGTVVLSGSKTAFVLMLIAVTINAVAAVRRLHAPSNLDIAMVACGWIIIATTLGWVVARVVFGAGRVTYHRIVGAVLLYLLIAVTFASLFVFLDLVFPKAFSGLNVSDNPGLASELIYFSLVTLTSTGYGDIYPVHPIARSLCNLETIIGQLYPATLLARLVTLEVANGSEPSSDEGSRDNRGPDR